MFPSARRASLLAALLLTAPALPARAGEPELLKLEVTELARTLDRVRKERFLTVTVEITGRDAMGLRRVQPLRDDFSLLAGKTALPCRWLRGGSVPEDPNRLRFTLGFSLPPRGTRKVSLTANLPRLEGEDVLEVRLGSLVAGKTPRQERQGAGWKLTVAAFEERDYVPPVLPPTGQFFSKGGPVDARVFRKENPKEPPLTRAVVLAFDSGGTELFDPTVDVSGVLIVDGGPSTPLVSALLRRDPSRAVKPPPYPPHVSGQLYFTVPPKGRPIGGVIRFHRPRRAGPQPVRVDNLELPD